MFEGFFILGICKKNLEKKRLSVYYVLKKEFEVQVNVMERISTVFNI